MAWSWFRDEGLKHPAGRSLFGNYYSGGRTSGYYDAHSAVFRGLVVMRIVLPFDGSAASVRAVEYVIGLAARIDGKERVAVDLVNVQAGAQGISFARDAADIAAKIVASSRESGTKVLATALSTLKKADVAAEPFVIIGEPADSIAAHIAKHGGDAVVMGTRGLGAVGGLVLGSVAAKVIHLVKVPVTLVK
jgi:nucleotide-binding universal stress UspA family protein